MLIQYNFFCVCFLLIVNELESAEAGLSLSLFPGHDPYKEPEVQMRVERPMSKPRKVHLFNFDRSYKLGAVEDWLNGTKLKLGFEFAIEQHYFSLSEMSEFKNKISGLQMDLAVFVVHAHGACLSINEDNAGIGYVMTYRALLQATGKYRFTFCTNQMQV